MNWPHLSRSALGAFGNLGHAGAAIRVLNVLNFACASHCSLSFGNGVAGPGWAKGEKTLPVRQTSGGGARPLECVCAFGLLVHVNALRWCRSDPWAWARAR